LNDIYLNCFDVKEEEEGREMGMTVGGIVKEYEKKGEGKKATVRQFVTNGHTRR
jgi:hypothetical protein